MARTSVSELTDGQRVEELFLVRDSQFGNTKKGQPYECGIDPIGSTKDPVPVKYFMVAISFILFDIEIIFLLPWAVVARDLGMFGFSAMSVFVLIILVGYFYELGKGALNWD